MYGVELKSDQNGKNLWRTTQGGGLKTATIFGQVTGFGAGQMIEHDTDLEDFLRTFEGCIVLDDINKIDDSGQENANNEKVSRVLFNTILSRKNSKDTPVINIQQRAGMSDATAQLMEHYEGSDKAKFLIMPVVNDKNEPLWEFKHNLADIEKLRTSPKTADVFQTQYMQEPVDFKDKLFEGIKTFTDRDAILEASEGSLAYIDVADEGTDYLCTLVGHVVGKLVYITDVVYTKANTDVTVPVIAELLNRYKVPYCRVETNGMGAILMKWLRKKLKRTELHGLTNKTNKETRIIMHSSYVLRKFRFLESPTGEYLRFINALKGYLKEGKNKNDDAPDATTGLAQMFEQYMPHLDE
jgi:predicted phage terminase large subunit-like protein